MDRQGDRGYPGTCPRSPQRAWPPADARASTTVVSMGNAPPSRPEGPDGSESPVVALSAPLLLATGGHGEPRERSAAPPRLGIKSSATQGWAGREGRAVPPPPEAVRQGPGAETVASHFERLRPTPVGPVTARVASGDWGGRGVQLEPGPWGPIHARHVGSARCVSGEEAAGAPPGHLGLSGRGRLGSRSDVGQVSGCPGARVHGCMGLGGAAARAGVNAPPTGPRVAGRDRWIVRWTGHVSTAGLQAALGAIAARSRGAGRGFTPQVSAACGFRREPSVGSTCRAVQGTARRTPAELR